MFTYIVTGANGFVGKNLVKRLAEDHDNRIICVIHSGDPDISAFEGLDNIEVMYCSMGEYDTLPEKLSEVSANCFIHLAWEYSAGPNRADYNIQLRNVANSIAAYRAAETIGCKRFLCAGTVSENVIEQVDSLSCISQNMIYAQAKKTLYEFLSILSKQSNTEFVWMQFSNTYGPGNTSGNLISYTFNEIDNGRTPEFGSGDQPYNFVHIDDLVNGIMLLSRAKLTQNRFFIGSDEVMLLREHLLQIPEAIGIDVEIGIGRRTDDGIVYRKEWFDISDLKKDTGYAPAYSFKEGIKNTYFKR